MDNQAGPSTPPGAPLSPPTSPLRLIGPSRARVSAGGGLAKEAAHDPLAEFYHEAKLQSQTEDRVSCGSRQSESLMMMMNLFVPVENSGT